MHRDLSPRLALPRFALLTENHRRKSNGESVVEHPYDIRVPDHPSLADEMSVNRRESKRCSPLGQEEKGDGM